MNTLPVVSLTPSSSFKFFHFPSSPLLSHSPTFRFTKSLILPPTTHLSFKSLNSLSPSQSQLSEDYDEDDEEEEDDDDDDDEAADEYDDITDEARNATDDDDEFPVDSPPPPPAESSRQQQQQRVEFRWQRVEKLRSLVRDFGVEMIDIDELVSIYDFRIDKFQVYHQLCLLF